MWQAVKCKKAQKVLLAIAAPALCAQLPIIVRAQDRNAAAQSLIEGTNQPSVHADIPFLDRSKSQIWYIYLVISIIGAAFLLSVTVVILGFVRWGQRRRLLLKAEKEGRLHEMQAKMHKCDYMEKGANEMQENLPVKSINLDLLSFKPSQEDIVRLRELESGDAEALKAERMRRTGVHEKALQALHHLRRLNSV